MVDLSEDGIEKAAEALAYAQHPHMEWNKWSDKFQEKYREEARRTVGAYLAVVEPTVSDGIVQDVIAERQRQINVEGWSPEHDDAHGNGEMAIAASCYAYQAAIPAITLPWRWPWHPKWWKPTNSRRDLVKAGALILAEIERLDRQPTPISDPPKACS